MEVQVNYLTRKRDGAVAKREEVVSCEALRLGRSTDNEIELSGPGVLLHEGTLHRRAGGLFFESLGRTSVIIDGKVGRHGPVRIGSQIKIGPYEVVILDPPNGKDVAISVELVQPIEDSLETLQRRSVTTLHETGLSKRTVAWGLTILVLALFFIWPVIERYAVGGSQEIPRSPRQVVQEERNIWPLAGDLAWTSGEISGPHKFIAHNCSACHDQPFVRVQDRVCVTCHQEVRHHVSPDLFPLPEITASLCESCHKEHEGPKHIVRGDQAFCASCHGDIRKVAATSEIMNARHFQDDHPEFRPIVITDASAFAMERLPLDPAKWPVEKSNLSFPHRKHLAAGGIIVPGQKDRRVLDCADCHIAEPGGVGFRPISMQGQCIGCHWLNFEATVPERVLPHGNVDAALQTLREFYSDLALRGAAEIEDAPAVVRRRPGAAAAPLTAAQRLEALAWAEQKMKSAAERVFSNQMCGACHAIEKNDDSWRVAPIFVSNRWFSKGKFTHARHQATACAECHAAAESETSADVLLPRVAVCRSCHGGEQSASRVPSTCVMCHDFHLPFQEVMRPAASKTAIRP